MSADKTYHRGANESARAWEAFCCYRDLGPSRSVVKVAQKLGKSGSLISRWSSKYKWVERIAIWQQDEDLQALETRNEEARVANQSHLALARSMLVGLGACIERAFANNELKPRDIPAWLKLAVQMERGALGMQEPVQRLHETIRTDITFHRDPGGIPDQVLTEAAAAMTPEDWQAAAHAILRQRRENLQKELVIAAKKETSPTDG